jgi:hypothetical protein
LIDGCADLRRTLAESDGTRAGHGRGVGSGLHPSPLGIGVTAIYGQC